MLVKTTTIKTILNILQPDSGEVSIFGLDSIKDEVEIKQHISVVFDEIPFHWGLNATQLDKILSEVYPQWDTSTFKTYLERFNLPLKKSISQLSKGMKMKLQIATALSHNADLLIMDEATGGLDPVVRNEMLDVFMEYIQDENHSILMSSHITSDLEKIADGITFVHNGKILMSDYKDDILENHALLKCPKDYSTMVDTSDIVSVRVSSFGAEVMLKDFTKCRGKYSNCVIDKTTLDEILLFYVRGMDKKEWSI